MGVQLDQQFTTGTGVEPLNQNWIWAQTFTCGLTGTLDSKVRTWFSVDFSSANIVMTSGVQYALGLAPIGGDPSPTDGHWYQQTSSGSYSGGNKKISYSSGSWWDYPNDDFNFKTYVEAPILVEADFTLDSSIAKALYVNSTLQGQVDSSLLIDSTLQGQMNDSLGLDSSIAYVEDNSRHKVTFEFGQGSPIVESNIDGGRMLARKSRIARIYAILEGTGTTGDDAIIDVNVDGVSVFTNQDYRPTIEMGSSSKYSERRPQIRNIDANSIITVDVDSIPDDASKLSVVIELNVATSYTHEVREVHLYDGDTLVSKTNYAGHTSSTFKFKVIFDEPCNTSYEPTITWAKETMASNPTIPTGGTWMSTYEANDTYTTPEIDVSDTSLYSGSAVISISDAKDVFDQDFSSFNFSIELADSSVVEFLESYTNQLPANFLLINSDVVSRFQYSLDQINWSSWTTFAPSTSVDLSDGAIGGPANEGTVNLYVRLESVEGAISNTIATLVYATTVGEVQDFTLTPTSKKNWFMAKWFLPSDANIAPIAKFEVYLGGTLMGEVTKIYPLNYSIKLSTATVDDPTRLITYAMTAGYAFDALGNKIIFDGTEEVEVDYPDTADRYDLLGINSKGEFAVITGVEGVSSRNFRLWEKEYSGGIGVFQDLPTIPTTPVDFLPLYYVRVTHYSFEDYTVDPVVTRNYAVIGENDIYYVARTRIQYLLKILKTNAGQDIKIKATSESSADSEYTKVFNKAVYPKVVYMELEAHTEAAGSGSEVQTGSIVTDADVTNNLIYLKFTESE